MNYSVIGWTSSYIVPYQEATFTEERKKALVERIRKRGYNFTYDMHQMLPYCTPFYNDKRYCVLSRSQWNDVMEAVYDDRPRGPRLIPMDVIEDRPVNDVLYEKKKFMEEYNGEN